ncbi:hypothetical protein AVEN_75508-1 [Araneus ventricosus]|uniref:Uncharacterized protein n=1 Tax=Araneus ventricosus TaxID=182803 RepID=A0A4Y2DPH5_ARAVE|nr:hypothetical protein AVEN_75508-1 [Araneus ventricosus]
MQPRKSSTRAREKRLSLLPVHTELQLRNLLTCLQMQHSRSFQCDRSMRSLPRLFFFQTITAILSIKEKNEYPDSNFSLQQACHKFVMTRVQACSKLTKASKSPWNEVAESLPCKLIANYSKNRVRTQPGIELATYRLIARRRYHSASSTTRGEDRFR